MRMRCTVPPQVLIGEHDFSAFRSIECQSKTPVRQVRRIDVQRAGDTIWLEIEANAYLHHMVRNIVGTLLDVQGRADPPAPWRASWPAGNGVSLG